MSNELERLHMIAFDLREIGMAQTAGDIDYLVSWLKSPEFNHGKHLAPHPAGKNTKDQYSNNCPIPFTVSGETIRCCRERLTASCIISEASDIINTLKAIYTDELELTALNSYIENLNEVKDLLDESEWQE